LQAAATQLILSSNQPTATLSLDHIGGQPVQWQATSEAAWLQLSSNAGTTPTDLLITYVAQEDNSETEGTITISNVDDPSQTIDISVILTQESAIGKILYLPLIVR